MNQQEKSAIKDWDEFHRSLNKSIHIDTNESEKDKLLRMQKLEADGNHEEWFKYYFPNYAICEPEQFHKDASTRFIDNDRWFESRVWSRELAKSTRAMEEVLYLALAKKKIKNCLMISSTEDNAERLLLPYKIALEKNDRIINDYGIQASIGTWQSFEFITRNGVSFRAVGAGQSPRGTRFENYRVDCVLMDDNDTDVECRNEALTKLKFKWFQEAVIPTVSVSGSYRILVCGNLISRTSVVAYCMQLAKHVDIVNIRDEHGKSTWPNKNSEEDIDAILSLMSYASAQKEYFNNPITEGTVFKAMAYKAMRPLKEYRFLVCYTDPSFKSTSKNDFKATVLVGKWKDEFHIIKGYCKQTTTAVMIGWLYEIDDFVNDEVPIYFFMEANFIQDTILPEIYREAEKRGKVIPIKGDKRKKDDKFTRIETLLEPLNTNGKLYLNIDDKDNPHMKTVEEQFLAIEPGSKAHDDAPDSVEGAVFIINGKKQFGNQQVSVIKPFKNPSKRH
jgi:hypothetical protein